MDKLNTNDSTSLENYKDYRTRKFLIFLTENQMLSKEKKMERGRDNSRREERSGRVLCQYLGQPQQLTLIVKCDGNLGIILA